jgi:hypothetical protein
VLRADKLGGGGGGGGLGLGMGLLSNRVERSEIRPGDHIYTWRAVYAYSHHGTLLSPLRIPMVIRIPALASSTT